MADPDTPGPGLLGHELRHAEKAEDTESGNDEERGPPADTLADVGAQGDSDDIGDGEPGEHHGDGAGLLLRSDQVGGNDRSDTEERSVGERGDDSSGEHHPEDGGERGHHVAHDEQPHQEHQHALAGDPGAQHRHQRSA